MKFEDEASYKKFWDFVDWLTAPVSSRTAANRLSSKNIEKLKRGVKVMRQLATSYGKEFIIPDRVKELLDKNFSSKITWIDFKIQGVEKVGLWRGANGTADGFPVFNLEWFNEVIKGRKKKDARAIIKFYIDNDCEAIG